MGPTKSPINIVYRGHNDCEAKIVCVRSPEQTRAVLIIEDERSVADALKIILEDNGYYAAVAATGRTGIDEALRGLFCLTITDIDLSDMTGFDVIKAICRHNSGMRFIVITANKSDELIAQARNCGAVGVLLKPFMPSEILQIVGPTLANADC